MPLHRFVAAVALAAGLAVSAPAAAQEPDTLSVPGLVEAGWLAARSDRHADAVRHFQRAMEREPALRRDLLVETAVRMTFSGRPADAVPLFREALAWDLPAEQKLRARRHLALALSWSGSLREAAGEYRALSDADPADVEARVGLARVLSWTGRLEESREQYERVLRQDPKHREARRGVAQLLTWTGRQREARALLRDLLAENPDDVETHFALAEAQAGVGRPDAARTTLTELLTRLPEHRPSQELLSRLRRQERPETRLDYQRIARSDRLDIGILTAVQSVQLNRGLSTLEGRYQRFDYTPGAGPAPRLSVSRPGVGLRHRVSSAAELTGSAHWNAIDAAGAEPDRSAFTYDGRFTWWPSDSYRLDALSSRTLLADDILSLLPAVTLTYTGGSADFLPDAVTRASLRANAGYTSDGNGRTWLQADAERRIVEQPALTLGAQYTRFGFDERSERYFSPDTYWSGTGVGRLAGHVRARLYWMAEGSYGWEAADAAGRRSIWSTSARANYHILGRWEASAWLLYFNSRRFFSAAEPTDGGSQFGVRMGGISLRYVW